MKESRYLSAATRWYYIIDLINRVTRVVLIYVPRISGSLTSPEARAVHGLGVVQGSSPALYTCMYVARENHVADRGNESNVYIAL